MGLAGQGAGWRAGLTGGVRGQVRVWDVESLACLATLQGHSGAVRALAASPDRVFSGSDDTTIKARRHAVGCLSGLLVHARWQRLLLRPLGRTVCLCCCCLACMHGRWKDAAVCGCTMQRC